MLRNFLIDHREAIFLSLEKKVKELSLGLENSQTANEALSSFFNQVVTVLEHDTLTRKQIASIVEKVNPRKIGSKFAIENQSISELVHLYGLMCESVTEVAKVSHYDIGPAEYQLFNIALDDAIALAVEHYETEQTQSIERKGTEHLGFLIHEIRNAVTTGQLALQTIQKGSVGVTGSVGRILHNSLERVHELIHRSIMELQLNHAFNGNRKTFRLKDLVDEVVASAELIAKKKRIKISTDMDTAVQVNADDEHIRSAISNLLHNATKFTKPDGQIQVKSWVEGEQITLSVEDECGGLPEDMDENEIFKSFTQGQAPKEGLGLGLSISRQAVRLNGGDITVKNLPPKGCIFQITLPRIKK